MQDKNTPKQDRPNSLYAYEESQETADRLSAEAAANDEQERLKQVKRDAKVAHGQLLPGRITALVVLGIVVVFFVGLGIVNLTTPVCSGVGFNPFCSGPGPEVRTYGGIDLLLAGCAAFGAVLVYWSRPRSDRP